MVIVSVFPCSVVVTLGLLLVALVYVCFPFCSGSSCVIVSRFMVVGGWPSVSCSVVFMVGGVLFFAVSVHSWLFFAPYSSVIVAFISYFPGVFGVSVMVFVSVMVSVVSSGFFICHLYVMLCPSGSVAVMLYVIVGFVSRITVVSGFVGV